MESTLESKLVDSLKNVGVNADMRPASNGERVFVVANVAAQRSRFQFVARFEDDGKMLVASCISGCRVPTGSVRSETDLANHINSRALPIGLLCIDSDGDVCFRASSFIDNENFDRVAQSLLAASASALDVFEPAFFSVVYANTPPEDAFSNALRMAS